MLLGKRGTVLGKRGTGRQAGTRSRAGARRRTPSFLVRCFLCREGARPERASGNRRWFAGNFGESLREIAKESQSRRVNFKALTSSTILSYRCRCVAHYSKDSTSPGNLLPPLSPVLGWSLRSKNEKTHTKKERKQKPGRTARRHPGFLLSLRTQHYIVPCLVLRERFLLTNKKSRLFVLCEGDFLNAFRSVARQSCYLVRKKENRHGREGWEDGTPLPHRDFPCLVS